MNFLDVRYLYMTFAEQTYISRSSGIQCRFSETFLHVSKLTKHHLQEGRSPMLIAVTVCRNKTSASCKRVREACETYSYFQNAICVILLHCWC